MSEQWGPWYYCVLILMLYCFHPVNCQFWNLGEIKDSFHVLYLFIFFVEKRGGIILESNQCKHAYLRRHSQGQISGHRQPNLLCILIDFENDNFFRILYYFKLVKLLNIKCRFLVTITSTTYLVASQNNTFDKFIRMMEVIDSNHSKQCRYSLVWNNHSMEKKNFNSCQNS